MKKNSIHIGLAAVAGLFAASGVLQRKEITLNSFLTI